MSGRGGGARARPIATRPPRAPDGPAAASSVDLHAHTTASDGLLDPPTLVAEALACGLRVLAVTDHDSVGGIAAAQQAAASRADAAPGAPALTVIPGLEINTAVGEAEVHVLGYDIAFQRPDLAAFLAEQRAARDERARAMVRKLQAAGLTIEYERVLAEAGGGAVGRPHLARALAAARLVRSPQEAFARWIGVGGPAYVARSRLSPAQAVERIVAAGGVAVLAHPAGMLDLEGWVARLAAAGLGGLECYYPGYRGAISAALLALARRYGLVPTGGSDFHGPGHAGRPSLGSVWVPPGTPEALRARRPRSTATGAALAPPTRERAV